MYVCVCVFVCERGKDREREGEATNIVLGIYKRAHPSDPTTSNLIQALKIHK